MSGGDNTKGIVANSLYCNKIDKLNSWSANTSPPLGYNKCATEPKAKA